MIVYPVHSISWNRCRQSQSSKYVHDFFVLKSVSLHRYEYGILRVGSRQRGGRAFPLQLRDRMGGCQQRSDMGSQVYTCHVNICHFNVYLCCVIYTSVYIAVCLLQLCIWVEFLYRSSLPILSNLTRGSSRHQDGWYILD